MANITNSTAYYPLVKGTLWERIKVAWRIVKYGDFYPQPWPWYPKVCDLVHGDLSHWAEMAVEKSEREYANQKLDPEKRLKEAMEWMTTYRNEFSREQKTIVQPHVKAFLVEWWVMRKKGHF